MYDLNTHIQSTEDLEQPGSSHDSPNNANNGRSSPSSTPIPAVRVMAVCLGAPLVMDHSPGSDRDGSMNGSRKSLGNGPDSPDISPELYSDEREDSPPSKVNTNKNAMSPRTQTNANAAQTSRTGRFSFDREQTIPVSTVSHTDHLNDSRVAYTRKDDRLYDETKGGAWVFRAPHWLWNRDKQRLYVDR